ncbi:YaaR family protein [Metabacillus litoralis]|uniref:YaaR family protein n=1 Tax=Metabacillus TaxID=2675233 RepID=UPI000EF5B697|nr:YaaR family protein [Metabacillus litoralis]MCM3164679.1 YaaR family protein [Metabacillus litoralis]MCM3413345.1 YaaR family protein [Metabacillus litoralis]UHA61056.1 YaaR family protein [Metabacillus litoralis]
MKISQDIRSTLDKRGMEQKVAQASSKGFQDLIVKQGNKLQNDQLTKLLANIDDAGRRLGKSRNFSDLSKYKLLVKKFIHEAVEYGMNMKQSRSWDYNGNSRSLKIIEQVDELLINLTDEMMSKESSSIDILAKIGEVKGLLVNLYT